jgi:putative PIN family toxin of toxin-antitoxin system
MYIFLSKYARWVKLGNVSVTVCRDPDDKVIETALIGMADYIVSEDKDLLVLREHEGVKIVKPADFLHLESL